MYLKEQNVLRNARGGSRGRRAFRAHLTAVHRAWRTMPPEQQEQYHQHAALEPPVVRLPQDIVDPTQRIHNHPGMPDLACTLVHLRAFNKWSIICCPMPRCGSGRLMSGAKRLKRLMPLLMSLFTTQGPSWTSMACGIATSTIEPAGRFVLVFARQIPGRRALVFSMGMWLAG